MPPNPPLQHNILWKEPEFVPEDIGLPGMDVEVTIREVLAVNVYDRLHDDLFLNYEMLEIYQEAVINLMQVYPGLDDEYEHLTQYGRSIRRIGRRYKKLKFDSTEYATDAELGAMLSQVASGYAFSGGQISWDGIAFVIMMVRQVIAETVFNRLHGVRDIFVMNWCIDYFSHPPHFHGEISINEWIASEPYQWTTLLEPYLAHAVIAPEPVEEPPHESDNIICRCEVLQRRHENMRRACAQCKFCDVYWCIIQECECLTDHPLDIITHQRRCHKYPSTVVQMPNCPTCNTPQLPCTDHTMPYQRCSGNAGGVACNTFWCLIDGCDENLTGLMNMRRHQGFDHPPFVYKCGDCDEERKVRDGSIRYNLCGCGIVWCLIGHCREEFDSLQELSDHQETCSYLS